MARQRIIGEWLEIPPVASTDEMIDHLNRTIRTLVEAIERIGAFVMYRSTASEKDPTVNPRGIWDLRDNTLIPHSATSGDVEPKEDGENDLGSSSYKWQKGWFNNIHVEDQLTDGSNNTTVQEVRTHIDTTSGNPHGVDFIELDDAPSDYTGRGGEIVLVKATEDGLDTQPWPATGVNLNYFLSDNSADIGGYYYMYPTETGNSSAQLTSSALGVGDDQLLWTFVTEAGEPGVDTLALGAYTATLYLQKSGNKDARVYWKLFKRDTGGNETELLQSAVSDQLTDTNSQYVISAYLNEDQVLDPTDRLVLKLYANVSGTGNDVSITLTMEGDYDSRILIHILSSSFSLDRLSDVDVSSPVDDELLAYDSGSGKWTNKTLSDVGTAEHGNEAHNPDFLAVDGSNSPTADIDWGGNKITNVSDPANAQDAATKNYVDTQDAGKADDPHGNEAHSPDFLAVDGSNEMQAKAKLSYGADLGLTTSTDRRTDGIYIARWNDIENIIMLDYQDEFAFLTRISGRSATVTPTPSLGNASLLFEDNPYYVEWNAGTDVSSGIVIEVDCSGNPINPMAHGYYRPALTFRWAGVSYPTHVKVEDWDNDNSTWVTVIDQDVSVVDHVLLLPRFAAQSSDYNIHKLKITLTVPSPLPDVLRLQRVILYHPTATWDPWHVHRRGDSMYGYLDMNNNKITNLANPTAAQDAATKNYADSKLPLDTSSAIDAYMSGNKWLSVATSGIVGLPKQSFVHVWMHHGGSNLSVTAETWTKIPFDTVIIDRQNEFDTVNNRFIATEDGVYIIAILLNITSLTDQARYILTPYKNGASWTFWAHLRASGTVEHKLTFVAPFYLNAGDYIEAFVYGDTAFSVLRGLGNSVFLVSKIA